MNVDSFHLLLIYFILSVVTAQTQNDEDAVCRTKNRKFAVWTCKKPADCEFKSSLESSGQLLRCNSGESSEEKICCPRRVTRKDPAKVAWEKCMEYVEPTYANTSKGGLLLGLEGKIVRELNCTTSQTLISGGAPAARDEFPHMALIGYPVRPGIIAWDCGGSLISEQFILSAAHCSRSNNITAKWVLLGERNRPPARSNIVRPGQFEIETAFIHPDYKAPNQNNDILLFKLRKLVKFGVTMRPICLFTSRSIPEAQLKAITITGWGTTGGDSDVSTTLQKAVINQIPDSSCKAAYKNAQLQSGFDSASMVCAGDIKYTGKDTCSGDSGGPMQIDLIGYDCMYMQVGITSLGPTFCGNKNNPVPAIYTKVAHYIGWIQSIVWP